MKAASLKVINTDVRVCLKENLDFISLTDIARFKDSERSDYILQNWIRLRHTIDFIGLWEKLHNVNFNSIEFDGIKMQAGINSFSLTPKRWIEATDAIGFITSAGRYGGTFAHKDIAFEFASWISPEFKLYLIKEFQRLKEKDSRLQDKEWSFKRMLAKVNYRIHTKAIQDRLIPLKLTRQQADRIYASEADVLNVALFGMTAKEWRDANSQKKGNIRDYAVVEQLVVLSNLESYNSILIHQGLSQKERVNRLNSTAIIQMRALVENSQIKKLL